MLELNADNSATVIILWKSEVNKRIYCFLKFNFSMANIASSSYIPLSKKAWKLNENKGILKGGVQKLTGFE